MTKRIAPQLKVVGLPGESETAAQARAAVTPTMSAAATARRYAPVENVDLTALSAELTRQASAVQTGDLSRAEEMLTAQAHTLDAIFNQLATRAANADDLPQLEALLKLALRAHPVPGAGGLGSRLRDPTPTARRLHKSSERRRRAPASQQRCSRAGNRASANPSSGANRWRTAGRRSGGQVLPSGSISGSRGSIPQDRRRQKVSAGRQCAATQAQRVQSCEDSPARSASRSTCWSGSARTAASRRVPFAGAFVGRWAGSPKNIFLYQTLKVFKWRRERDSNPRWAFNPYSLSRGAPSATRPSLRGGCLRAAEYSRKTEQVKRRLAFPPRSIAVGAAARD
jgi:hypothetical protein